MPELGQYTNSVIGAYVVSFLIIGFFLVRTLIKSYRAKKNLTQLTASLKKFNR
jgi:hypothetical protein